MCFYGFSLKKFLSPNRQRVTFSDLLKPINRPIFWILMLICLLLFKMSTYKIWIVSLKEISYTLKLDFFHRWQWKNAITFFKEDYFFKIRNANKPIYYSCLLFKWPLVCVNLETLWGRDGMTQTFKSLLFLKITTLVTALLLNLQKALAHVLQRYYGCFRQSH